MIVPYPNLLIYRTSGDLLRSLNIGSHVQVCRRLHRHVLPLLTLHSPRHSSLRHHQLLRRPPHPPRQSMPIVNSFSDHPIISPTTTCVACSPISQNTHRSMCNQNHMYSNSMDSALTRFRCGGQRRSRSGQVSRRIKSSNCRSFATYGWMPFSKREAYFRAWKTISDEVASRGDIQ